ncbi:glutamate-5-semialdehyde dehydrogenase [Phascolarctobacterium succinatutens]|jgi:glutamate-5-semialdehyde dehydrogenase|uniref:Gamma-glutamyl phosphate reductase n=1 Tax=Phascolarctobacterium succinatutens YIT 12067 TaxID=626939 RepID=E8LDN2_9FIRM|nr:glutamate-5-semialdehyde dehydrogenase [Phascolarctobacterium succinatutens]EFY05071.1 glutamate-5-semialdehyde dehydrogenase [Phascolarctobacterium succinatutens YIT 12067]MDD7140745.1 glutamate-5-semialdehyde dehydrogenase [Phascolarctobacterium succinatutens]MDY3841150.1 glutamate-5-semialdehyde dehydrogenase [Phascolarctobacterium succinatutens]
MATYELVKAKAQAAKQAAAKLAVTSTAVKNAALLAMAAALEAQQSEILAANERDMTAAAAKGMKSSMLDRLKLTAERISGMADGLRQVAGLADPVGNVIDGKTLPNGLHITKIRVPLGVIGIIYEARPNVTADAAGLCLKSGNAVILKGGSEAMESNKTVAAILAQAAEGAGIPADSIQFIDTSDRQAVQDLIHMNGLVDVVIPRGGAGLIQAVVRNASVPVIETGAGVCHTYVDKDADVEMAMKIAFNAKVQRPSVCNAMETLLVHKDIADKFLPMMLMMYNSSAVEICGDEAVQEYSGQVHPVTEEDWSTEYGDLRLSVKIVDSIEEAMAHIAKYGTGHSECIVTNNYQAAQLFQYTVDAAAVYVNASTRFTDGNEFGFGAEIGISTQKLHARGPMALPELTSTKYLINGNGQVRK